MLRKKQNKDKHWASVNFRHQINCFIWITYYVLSSHVIR